MVVSPVQDMYNDCETLVSNRTGDTEYFHVGVGLHQGSEPKCARGGHIIFLESIFQHSPHEIVIYSINRKSYNKKVNIL